MNCPKCSSHGFSEDCIVNEKQRYKCKSYGISLSGVYPAIKRKHYSFEELGFRLIRRFLKCSHVSVYNWSRRM